MSNIKYYSQTVVKSYEGKYRSISAILELTLMSQFSSPNLMPVSSFTIESNFISLEMPKGTTLRNYIFTETVDYQDRILFCLQILRAVHALHSQGIIHNDIKPDNIIIFEDKTLRLTDFGFSATCGIEGNYKTSRRMMTPLYASKELISSSLKHETITYDFDSDIWSTALTFLFILTSSDFNSSAETFQDLFSLNARILSRLAEVQISPEMREIVSIMVQCKTTLFEEREWLQRLEDYLDIEFEPERKITVELPLIQTFKSNSVKEVMEEFPGNLPCCILFLSLEYAWILPDLSFEAYIITAASLYLHSSKVQSEFKNWLNNKIAIQVAILVSSLDGKCLINSFYDSAMGCDLLLENLKLQLTRPYSSNKFDHKRMANNHIMSRILMRMIVSG